MGDMMTFKVFKRLSQTRDVQRTSNRDITKRRSVNKPQKARKRQNLVFQSKLRLSKFLRFHQFLTNILTSGGFENFSMDGMMTFKVFQRFTKTRAVQRTLKHDITKRRSGAEPQKAHKRQKLVFQSKLRLSKFLSFSRCLMFEKFCVLLFLQKWVKNNPNNVYIF